MSLRRLSRVIPISLHNLGGNANQINSQLTGKASCGFGMIETDKKWPLSNFVGVVVELAQLIARGAAEGSRIYATRSVALCLFLNRPVWNAAQPTGTCASRISVPHFWYGVFFSKDYIFSFALQFSGGIGEKIRNRGNNAYFSGSVGHTWCGYYTSSGFRRATLRNWRNPWTLHFDYCCGVDASTLVATENKFGKKTWLISL